MATVWQVCAAQDNEEDESWSNCSDLGMSRIVRTCDGAGIDTVTFDLASGTALTDDDLFAYHAYVRFRKVVDEVSTLYFFGRVTSLPRDAQGEQLEKQSVTVSGPGEQLASLVYRQAWVESTGTIRKPLVVLYQDADGNRCTTGAQIYDALSWAKTCGVKISEPSSLLIITGVTLPYDERTNIKCYDVIVEALRWHPHAVCWWDYTERLPVFHCALRTALTASSIALTSLSGLSIRPRTDLQIPAMAIAYTKAYQVDDASWTRTYFDYAPTIAEETDEALTTRLNGVDVVWANFDLDGYSRMNLQQKMVVEDFPADYESIAWWKAREPWLKEYDDANISLDNGQRMNDTALTSIIVEGTPQPWMNVEVANERICVDATITAYEGGQLVVVETRQITLVVQATDAVTKTYKKLMALDTGESIPEGVCASLYAEWSGLHYEGSFVVEEDECSGTYALGKSVNITGGRSAWSAMAAMISHTVESLDDGTTTVDFGTIKTVDVDSLVALFRATRNRQFSYRRTMRSGAADPETDGEGNSLLASNPGYSGLSTTKRRVILDIAAEVKHLIDLNSGAFQFETEADGNTPRVITPREVLIPYLDANGNPAAKLAQCLCSEGYGDEHQLIGTPDAPESPKVLGVASEGSSDDALTDTFDPATAEEDGVSLWVLCRERFDHAGSKTWYAYFRKLTWPKQIAPAVTGETRMTVDTPQS